MPDLNQNADLVDRLMREGVDKSEAWDAIAAKNAIIASQATEISRLRDALTEISCLHHTEKLLWWQIRARTALEANHG